MNEPVDRCATTGKRCCCCVHVWLLRISSRNNEALDLEDDDGLASLITIHDYHRCCPCPAGRLRLRLRLLLLLLVLPTILFFSVDLRGLQLTQSWIKGRSRGVSISSWVFFLLLVLPPVLHYLNRRLVVRTIGLEVFSSFLGR